MIGSTCNIPLQLRYPEYRFIKVADHQKKPIEQDWQHTKNYRWDDPELVHHTCNGGNYGVATGFGQLVVIDADEDEIAALVERNLPSTLTVKTGSDGRHYYYKCTDLDKPIRLRKPGSDKVGDIGDIKWVGGQVIGPGSIHPNGNRYVILKDESIREIAKEDIMSCLIDYIKVETNEQEERDEAKKNNTDISTIRIGDVCNLSGLRRTGDEYQGEHPIHGSKTGMNFRVNVSKDTWYCFRHSTGGGPLSWLAVENKLIDCQDATKGCLRGDRFKDVLAIAMDRGLVKNPVRVESKAQDKESKKAEKGEQRQNIADEVIESLKVKVISDTGTLMIFDGGVYTSDTADVTVAMEIKKHLGVDCSTHEMNEIVKAFIKTSPAAVIQRDQINSNPMKIILENGVYDIDTNTFSEYRPDVISTIKLPFKYDKDAQCPKFLKFLTDVVSSETDMQTIQEYTGYSLYGDCKYEKALMLVGPGANGKGVLLSFIRALLGPRNISAHSLQQIEKSEYASSTLFGKLANICNDLSRDALEKADLIKQLISGDDVQARDIYSKGFRFQNRAKFWFSTNNPPVFYDMTDGFIRRWLFIDFKNVFTPGDGKCNPNLRKEMITPSELSGAFNWAMAGLRRLLDNNRFSDNTSTDDNRNHYIRLSDPLTAFIDDCVEVSQDFKVPKDEFYLLYRDYCIDNKLTPVSMNTIKSMLKERIRGIYEPTADAGTKAQKKRVKCWGGIRVEGFNWTDYNTKVDLEIGDGGAKSTEYKPDGSKVTHTLASHIDEDGDYVP